MRRILPPLLTAATLLLVAVPAASARTVNYWIAAKPVTWNMIPNERDAIMGTTYAPSQTVFPMPSVTAPSVQAWHTPGAGTP